ncbi:MAG: hypothetical protein Q8P15_02875 [Nanoarchaeota archaeon]|nr:hypothetical protein [Nanoarchaeota archaeon]
MAEKLENSERNEETTNFIYREGRRMGDIAIDLGDGDGLVLNKMPGKRYFLEVHREIRKNGESTGAYFRICYDENKAPIFDVIDGKPVPAKKEIDSYFPKLEKFMDQNEKVQSLKLEIRVKK